MVLSLAKDGLITVKFNDIIVNGKPRKTFAISFSIMILSFVDHNVRGYYHYIFLKQVILTIYFG